jgi:hypothetical protein
MVLRAGAGSRKPRLFHTANVPTFPVYSHPASGWKLGELKCGPPVLQKSYTGIKECGLLQPVLEDHVKPILRSFDHRHSHSPAGTTRMSTDTKTHGRSNCKVHGVEGLAAYGASVFPRLVMNLTLMIVALLFACRSFAGSQCHREILSELECLRHRRCCSGKDPQAVCG